MAAAIHFWHRGPSRGLHYHASTQNWPMIAGGRSELYNDRVRVRDSDTWSRQFKIKELLETKSSGTMACTPRARSSWLGRCKHLLLALGDARRSACQCRFRSQRRCPDRKHVRNLYMVVRDAAVDWGQRITSRVEWQVVDCIIMHPRKTGP